MSIGPKPSLLTYERERFDAWKQDTLVWCAEAMQDAAERIERSLGSPRGPHGLDTSPFEEPTYEDVEKGFAFFDRWHERRERRRAEKHLRARRGPA